MLAIISLEFIQQKCLASRCACDLIRYYGEVPQANDCVHNKWLKKMHWMITQPGLQTTTWWSNESSLWFTIPVECQFDLSLAVRSPLEINKNLSTESAKRQEWPGLPKIRVRCRSFLCAAKDTSLFEMQLRLFRVRAVPCGFPTFQCSMPR